MTQDEKSILLKDLCARLPYRVKCFVPIENLTMELTGKRLNYFCFHKEEWGFDYSHEFEVVLDPLNDARNGCVIKPYLRPISSMTEEESIEWFNYHHEIELEEVKSSGNYLKAATLGEAASIDWLNKNHFDYRGLIPMGLAIEVNENNNPYKD